jgi:L-aminopeptidase/D-esterase-like protein
MGSQTAKGYPYPIGTDRVMDGDNAIQALAEAIDTKAGVAAAGVGTVTVGGSGGSGTAAITFPAGLFSAVPTVVANSQVGDPSKYPGSCLNVTATGCLLAAVRPNAGTVPVAWIAIQI